MSPSMLAVIYGLISAGLWGSGDFLGGLATRRASVLATLLISELVGIPVLLVLALIQREPFLTPNGVLWSIAAGALGLIAVGALYQALAVGNAAVVAPTTGILGAAIPVIFSILSEGLPRQTQLLGCAVGVLGIWLVTRSEHGDGTRRGIGLAMIAGLGFGFYFICFKQVGGEAIFWPILISRAITYVVVLIFAFLRRQTLISSPWRTIAGPAALSGLCDSGANATYILASTHGSLAIVAVLASLYPAITVILARFVLNETIVRLQLIGLGVTLVAIVLIAS